MVAVGFVLVESNVLLEGSVLGERLCNKALLAVGDEGESLCGMAEISCIERRDARLLYSGRSSKTMKLCADCAGTVGFSPPLCLGNVARQQGAAFHYLLVYFTMNM